MKAVLFYKKDSKKTISFIKHKYKGEEFPDNIGLSENSLIVRKHNEKDCINLMNKWYKEIEHYSHRDQLSFGYILWKMRYKKVKYISKEFTSEYFMKNEVHLKKIIFKK